MRDSTTTSPTRSWLLFALLLVLAGAHPARTEEQSNRLAGERSPYLRQHANNPVDWYPWGDEAFQRAKRESKPVFLSIGYAACHWCHVMEHESFEDPRTATMLNRAFICVKVDREERPDIDDLYMRAIYALGSRGGWPATLVLTPDGDPFWGGTYLSRSATRSLAARMQSSWARDRRSLVAKAKRVAAQLRAQSGPPRLPRSGASDAQVIHQFRLNLQRSFDRGQGGYRQSRKFPPHAELLYFLDRGGALARPEDLAMMRKTLEAMDEGGIHDQVGGGFHRYTVDAIWLVPHFEKMLYDNALLIQAYAMMAARSKDPRFRRAADRALAWNERALKRPGGGYGSSLDADTAGHEGTTYTWTIRQLQSTLAPSDYPFAVELFGATQRGNFTEGGVFAGATGRNVLYLPRPLTTVAARARTDLARIRRGLDGVTARLLAARQRRAQPALDEKVITAWNGMLLGAMARAGESFQDERYLERARRLATFLLEHSRLPGGTLLRFPAGSGKPLPGYADDHVWLIDGLLLLGEATGEQSWTAAATDLGQRLIRDFEDRANGGFWSTSARHEELFARQKGYEDSPIPSDNGMAARVLLKLHARTGKAEFQRAAARTLAAFRPLLAQGRGTRTFACLAHALALRRALATSGRGRARRGEVFVRQDVAEADVFLDRAIVRPESEVSVLVRVALDEGWHVNANEPEPSGEALVGTTLGLEQGAPVQLGEVTYPPPVRKRAGTTGEILALYEGTFDLRATLRVPRLTPRGSFSVPLLLTLQACDQNTCKEPMVLRLLLTLSVGSQNGGRLHPELFR